MKRGSTLFLKITIFVIGIGALASCIFVLPEIWNGGSEEFPTASRAAFIIMIILYVTAVPFLVALWQAYKLLSYIDKNKAFSDLSIKALRNIKYCAIIIAVLYFACVPFLVPIAEADDAPGLVLIGLVLACTPIVVAVFAAVLEKLFQSGLDIKSENELTV